MSTGAEGFNAEPAETELATGGRRSRPSPVAGTMWIVVARLYGAGVRLQELLGHADVSPTMISVHVLNRGALGVRSPADRL